MTTSWEDERDAKRDVDSCHQSKTKAYNLLKFILFNFRFVEIL